MRGKPVRTDEGRPPIAAGRIEVVVAGPAAAAAVPALAVVSGGRERRLRRSRRVDVAASLGLTTRRSTLSD